MALSADQLQQELANTAEEFSAQLRKLVVAIDGDISQVFRNTILRVEANIIKRSPVDTGAYRASHGIANFEPSSDQDAVKGKKGQALSASIAEQRAKAWNWKVGDGDIWLYNNVPYAERIENGWSSPGGGGKSVVKAPEGVYRVALVEIKNFLQTELAKFKSFAPMGGSAE
jgi:hypothetical protein